MPSTRSQNIFLFITCLVVLGILNILSNDIPTFKRKHINTDVIQYYSFVTAVFECKDLSYKNSCPYNHQSLPIDGGRFVNKRSIGMAYMYTPFYCMSQVMAKLQGKYDDGYSRQTQNILVIGIWIYFCIGLFFLGKTLFRFFSYPVVVFCLFSLTICTNLSWYLLGEPLFTHAVNFMWMSILMYATILFHQNKKTGWLLIIAFSLSMLALIRPNNIMLGLFPLLYGVYNKETFIRKWQLIKECGYPIMLAMVIFFIPIIPQFLYWKYATDHWLYYSYTGEQFYWFRPLVLEVLFSYRKGWFVYTPFMLLIIPGFLYLKRNAISFFLPVVIIFPLFLYVTSCWWAWSYGGCFGMRPMIDIYPMLIICVAALLQNKRWFIWVPVITFTLFCGQLNLFQTYQYQVGVLHWDQMNKKTYWAIWGKDKWPLEYDLLVSYPDYLKEASGKGSYYTLEELTDGEFSMRFIRSKWVAPYDTIGNTLYSHGNNMPYPNSFTFKYNAFKHGFTIMSTSTQTYWVVDNNGRILSGEIDILFASVFNIKPMGNNKFVMKAPNDKFVVSDESTGFQLMAVADTITEKSWFVLQKYIP